jgi:site-specific DNA-cytosine methylase
LPIEAIVHIEHDPVAVHVIKWNHKHDGIKHTYIEKFEDIYGNDSDPNVNKLDELVSQHGVFDLVTSGAPCQNLSGLNACRDVDALNAQYLMKVGKLIKRLDLLQRSNGMEERILFLSENVVFHEYEQFDVHYSDFSPEGLSPMRVDAKDVGPVKRNRLYWMNVSVLVVCIAPAVANLILLSFLASTDASEQL